MRKKSDGEKQSYAPTNGKKVALGIMGEGSRHPGGGPCHFSGNTGKKRSELKCRFSSVKCLRASVGGGVARSI